MSHHPPSHPHKYTLYTFFASSCTARVRMAAAHKHIPLTYKYVKLHKGDQHLPAFITSINPSASVPALCVYPREADEVTSPLAIITQSVAIIEYLEEAFPTDIKLLPPPGQPLLRAKVRELTGVVVCDIQPVTNMRVFKHVAGLVSPEAPEKWSEDEWQRHFMMLGLRAYESLASGCAGRYSVGDQVTMADLCLVAAVDRAMRYNIDIRLFPVVSRVYEEVRILEAYKKGGFRSQPDTFRSLRDDGGEGKL